VEGQEEEWKGKRGSERGGGEGRKAGGKALFI